MTNDKSERIETVCISCGNHLTVTSVLCGDCSKPSPATRLHELAAEHTCSAEELEQAAELLAELSDHGYKPVDVVNRFIADYLQDEGE